MPITSLVGLLPCSAMAAPDSLISYDLSSRQAQIMERSTAYVPLTSVREGSLPTVHHGGRRSLVGEEDATVVSASDAAAWPWVTAVKLEIERNDGTSGSCSGIIVAPYHVLTAGHCLYDHDHGGWAGAVEVIAGHGDPSHPFGVALAETLRTYVEWIDSESRDWDFAIVILDRDLGSFTGWLGMEYNSDGDWYIGTSLNMNHYPGDILGDGDTLFHGYDEVIDAPGSQLLHLIDTQPGSSGAGLYRYDADADSRYVQAVHSFSTDEETHNGASRIDDVKWADLHQGFAEDPPPTNRPDLEVVEADAELLGDHIEVSFEIRNLGTLAAPAHTASVLLSESDSDLEHEHVIGHVLVDSVEPFYTASVRAQLDRPEGLSGVFYAALAVDPDDEQEEFDEENNLGIAPTRLILETEEEEPSTWDEQPPRDHTSDRGCGCGMGGGPWPARFVPLSLLALAMSRRASLLKQRGVTTPREHRCL